MQSIKFESNKVFFFDIRGASEGINTPGIIKKLDIEIIKLLEEILPISSEKNAILKTHIGEPLKRTHMKPELLKPFSEYLQNKGVNDVVYGDTTVAYSGERGYKENPESDASRYLVLAKQNGFQHLPFVVLDRPVTKTANLDFNEVHHELTMKNDKIRYKKIYPSGAFLKADLIINNAHLTGHLLAKNALCNKSISMGLSSYAGKIQLHQNLYPEIDNNACTLCGKCVRECPVSALEITTDLVKFNFDLCIGCGQCATGCPVSAIKMVSQGIQTWNKGVESLDIRMSEYTIAMLSIYKGKMLHVGHLYNITSGCDCMNQKETPNCKDIGIVVGYNPFAVDFTSTVLESMLKKGNAKVSDVSEMVSFANTKSRFEVYEYIKENFGINYLPELEIIKLN
mgnify:CR=1 FL=1